MPKEIELGLPSLLGKFKIEKLGFVHHVESFDLKIIQSAIGTYVSEV